MWDIVRKCGSFLSFSLHFEVNHLKIKGCCQFVHDLSSIYRKYVMVVFNPREDLIIPLTCIQKNILLQQNCCNISNKKKWAYFSWLGKRMYNPTTQVHILSNADLGSYYFFKHCRAFPYHFPFKKNQISNATKMVKQHFFSIDALIYNKKLQLNKNHK
jgi:hypothetical protein